MADAPKKRTVRLAGVEAVAPETFALHIALPAGDAMHFDPGQFVTFYVAKNGATVTRSYSVMSTPDVADRFDLVVKRVEGGYVSNWLCSRPAGEELRMVGPLGKFLLREPGERSVLFVSTGTGIAPFLPMTERLLRQSPAHDTWLFFGTRTESEILFRERFEALQAANPRFHYVPVLSRAGPEWGGARGHVEAPLRERFPDLSGCDLYICGVPQMVQEVRELAETLHAPKERVFVERY